MQLITDGLIAYSEAVEEVFGYEVDLTQLIKVFDPKTDDVDTVKRVITGMVGMEWKTSAA